MRNTAPSASGATNLRADIQVLRGIAVLFVLFYHAKVGPESGYLGVDIFFVISGYLITGLIKRDIEAGRFSFKGFYFRRAKRLLPAAYVTFLIAAILAPVFLTSSGMSDFNAQMIGALTFTANMVLYKQSGYFGGDAELKPLLHVWSLAVEEQYYFILPLTMALLIPRRHWLKGAVVIVLASFGLCVFFSGKSLAFYFLPTRAWELGVGSIGALLTVTPLVNRLVKIAFWPSLFLLFAIPSIKVSGFHPGPAALIVCLAAVVVILRRHSVLDRGLLVKTLSKVGDISYSLYLVHWPIFAFFNNAWVDVPGGERPFVIVFPLLVLSFFSAFVLYKFVEKPVHYANFGLSKKSVSGFSFVSVFLVLATSGVVQATKSEKDYQFSSRMNVGLAKECSYRDGFDRLPACQTTDDPSVIVWGDSFAMHWVAGVSHVVDDGVGVIQATKSMCGPVLNLSVIRTVENNRAWAEKCIQFSQSVFNYIESNSSIKTVVLSSPFNQFTDPAESLLKLDRSTGEYHVVQAGVEEALQGFRDTLAMLRAAEKNVIVISPPPQTGVDLARCVERMERGFLSIGPEMLCQVALDVYRKQRGSVIEFIKEIEQDKNIRLVNLDRYLCDSQECTTSVEGQFIYRDSGHLSYGGSVAMAQKIGLKGLIAEMPK